MDVWPRGGGVALGGIVNEPAGGEKKTGGPLGGGAGTRCAWRVKGTPSAVPQGVWCGVGAAARAVF